MVDYISIRGAKENNLKNIDIDIPKGKLVVFSGVSGSGKSTLAFSVIFSESQRRYLDSLSPYARRFLDSYSKPDVSSIEGLSPAIAINQKSISKNPRSTVSTITEIHDYMRIMYAKIGIPHSLVTGLPIAKLSISQIVDNIMEIPSGSIIRVMCIVNHELTHKFLKKYNVKQIKVDKKILDVNLMKTFSEIKEGSKVFVVLEHLLLLSSERNRLEYAVESVLQIGNNNGVEQNSIHVEILSLSESTENQNKHYTNNQVIIINDKCSFYEGDLIFEDLQPKLFSFNSPHGACTFCNGLGKKEMIDPSALIMNPTLSIEDGALLPIGALNNENNLGLHPMMRQCKKILRPIIEKCNYSCSTSWRELSEETKKFVLYGSEDVMHINVVNEEGGVSNTVIQFPGIINILDKILSEDARISEYMSVLNCPMCNGQRLNPKALSVKILGKNIGEVTAMSVDEVHVWFKTLGECLSELELHIAEKLINEITNRLSFLQDVGLCYIALSREASTLSGGEGQRIRLASQIGSGLSGIIYVLDEPSVGLHQSDNDRLIYAVRQLQKLGNSILIVEHDEDTILMADYIVDIGPIAGEGGGNVVIAGTPDEIKASKDSLTGAYLSGRRSIATPKTRRVAKHFMNIRGANINNLKNFDVDFPVGCFTVVTGVSGGGKSTLVMNVLYNAVINSLKYPEYAKICGFEQIDKILNIDQSPIGRTPASNPATYTGLFTHIRNWYGSLPASKAMGYNASRFSFNSRGGRCEACRGDGSLKVEMYFLPDIYVKCEKCNGTRYDSETLGILYKNKSIADVLSMSVTEALVLFESIPLVKEKLESLRDVGLGYIKLGQSSTTLSGGEAQRVKLSKELSKHCTGRTLYILDEPTTGLHLSDIDVLLKVLHALVDKGNTLVVIEHNLHVIKTADHVIDLGPVGGFRGGYLVAKGTPEEIVATETSITGNYLRPLLKQNN